MNRPQPPGGIPLDIPDLYRALHELLLQVPRGRVTTYGALAEALGAVAAARWVAAYLLEPDSADGLPRHRVVLRDGVPGRFWTGDTAEKIRLLTDEGVVFTGGRVDLEKYAVRGFDSPRPLVRLQQVQVQLLDCVDLRPPDRLPEFAGGVDVSYLSASAGGPVPAVAAYALVHVPTRELVWSHTVAQSVLFPYIPGFLAFRELPILLALLEEVRAYDRLAEVVLVDGNGRLHQRHAGIATHLGVAAGVRTIGIGKSLLCGSVGKTAGGDAEAQPVFYEGKQVACALAPRPGGKPIYVSPGTGVDLPFAVTLTRLLLDSHRVPEPIHHAHTQSRLAARTTPELRRGQNQLRGSP